MTYEDNPKSIKYYVKKFILARKEFFKGKQIVDFPAGNGITSRILKEVGAEPIPFDLFPEYFQVPEIICKKADISSGIPLDDGAVEAAICQEGIEHFSDQFQALKEFSRILKPGGILLVTTPNHSNLRSRFSFLLGETERIHGLMPPNELDSVWRDGSGMGQEIYLGHLFLIGIQKLRTLARLAGFRIKSIHPTRVKSTSLVLLPFCYPFILLSNMITYVNCMRKKTQHSSERKKKVYRSQFRLAVNPAIMIYSHLMVEFEKEI